ncbi:uncharacterized protein [Physcomitrium patens]
MNPSSKGLNRGAPIPPHPLEGFITVAREFLTPGLNRLKRAVAALIPHSLREIVVGGGRLLTSLARTVRQFPAVCVRQRSRNGYFPKWVYGETRPALNPLTAGRFPRNESIAFNQLGK